MSTSEEVGRNRPQECPREAVTRGDVISARSHDRFSSFFTFTIKSHFPPSSVDRFVQFCPVSKPLRERKASRREANCTGIEEKELEWSRMGFWTQVKGGEMICVVIRMWTDENGKA